LRFPKEKDRRKPLCYLRIVYEIAEAIPYNDNVSNSFYEKEFAMIVKYPRQSVDRADSISIKSQLYFCKYKTRGKYSMFTQSVASAESTNHPALKKLLIDIESSVIHRVTI